MVLIIVPIHNKIFTELIQSAIHRQKLSTHKRSIKQTSKQQDPNAKQVDLKTTSTSVVTVTENKSSRTDDCMFLQLHFVYAIVLQYLIHCSNKCINMYHTERQSKTLLSFLQEKAMRSGVGMSTRDNYSNSSEAVFPTIVHGMHFRTIRPVDVLFRFHYPPVQSVQDFAFQMTSPQATKLNAISNVIMDPSLMFLLRMTLQQPRQSHDLLQKGIFRILY